MPDAINKPNSAAPARNLIGPRKKQHRSLPTYSGALNDPIDATIKDDLDAAQAQKDLDQYVDHERMKKLMLLAKACGYQSGDQYLWMALCFHLAYDFVPGFRVRGDSSDRYNGISGRGPPKAALEHFEICVAVDSKLENNGNVAAACRELCRNDGPYKDKQPGTLETIYHSNKRDPVPISLALAREIAGKPKQK